MWKCKLPCIFLVLGVVFYGAQRGHLMNAHAWGLTEIIYLAISLPAWVFPFSLVFYPVNLWLNHLNPTMNWNIVRMMEGFLVWTIVLWGVGHFMDKRSRRK